MTPRGLTVKSDNLDLVGSRPSVALALNREAVLATLARFPVSNPRVFGSVLHGTDHQGSDLDLLVDPLPGTTLFDLGGLQEALTELLGINVDVLTAGDISRRFRDRVLAEARPL